MSKVFSITLHTFIPPLLPFTKSSNCFQFKHFPFTSLNSNELALHAFLSLFSYLVQGRSLSLNYRPQQTRTLFQPIVLHSFAPHFQTNSQSLFHFFIHLFLTPTPLLTASLLHLSFQVTPHIFCKYFIFISFSLRLSFMLLLKFPLLMSLLAQLLFHSTLSSIPSF